MTVQLEKDTAMNLITYKKNSIYKMIEEILNRWKEVSIDQFLNNAKIGIHKNAENDAIDLKQLLIEEKKLNELLASILGD